MKSPASSRESRRLNHVEQLRGKARSAATEAIDSGTALSDLGALGEARLANGRLAGRLKQEVATAGQKGQSRQEAARLRPRHTATVRRKAASPELALELEAENFVAWRGPLEPRR